MTALLEARRVVKAFGATPALRGVDLSASAVTGGFGGAVGAALAVLALPPAAVLVSVSAGAAGLPHLRRAIDVE